jgi:hypothetical protein
LADLARYRPQIRI